MAVDVLPNPTQTASNEPSATTLVSGIVKDAQELFKQQVALLKLEAEEDLRATTQAAIAMAIGLGIALIGAILLALAVVHLLAYLVPGQPIGVWYALVGLVVVICGGILVAIAIYEFSKINPPLPQTQEALKETVEWQTNKPK
jgi:hypothetical protein